MTTDKLIDLDSFARIYWTNELMKNGDGLIFSSTYISKDRGEGTKLVFGPAWDFNLSVGNPNVFGGAEGVKFSDGWWIRTSDIGFDLMRNPLVQSAVVRYKPTAVSAMNEVLNGGALDSPKARIRASHGLNAYVWGARPEDRMRLKSWLNQRPF